jgi:hypothetical protein
LRYLLRFFVFILILAGIAEIVLRTKYGFCNAPLYVADQDYEYIFAPNQDLTRFGNKIRTNHFSMRSEVVESTDSTVILLVGDSVINGGNLTDQDSLATTKLEQSLSKTLQKKVRVLNIAAGSWGPDNMAAYLRKHGTFNAQLICLVTSSHDIHDIMSHEPIVGINPNMPDKQYKVALVELWERYKDIIFYQIKETINPTPVQPEAPSDSAVTLDESGITKSGIGFNPGYQEIMDIAQKDSIPLIIFLHPEISEVRAQQFNTQGQEIKAFAQEQGVPLYDELKLGIQLDEYRKMDVIHYNDLGQNKLAERLSPIFIEYLNKK